jgi:hypothetical protein
LPGNDADWLLGVASVFFVVFLLARFNRHRLGALWERWENMPPHVHLFANSVLFGGLAVVWKLEGRDPEFWAWSFLAALHLVVGIGLLLDKNKPVDASPAARRQRAVLGAVWSFALLLPLAWMIARAAKGAEIESVFWGLSLGVATAGTVGLFDSVRKWKGASGA